MILETPTKNLHIGGYGCKMCRFWQRYKKQQTLLLRLPDSVNNSDTSTWGRCFNNENISDCFSKPQKFSETSKDKANTDIEKLSEDTIILSTTENYGCDRFRGLKVEPKQED